MADTVRWGILSTANIARKRVIPAIDKAVNGEVVAVASRNQDRAREFANALNIAAAYGSYEDLLAADDVDAIYIGLPNSMHMEWAIKCAQAGKPTLCEKPLAANADEAQHMVDAFEEAGVLFAEAFMYRFHPQNQRVHQMLQDGAIGAVHTINAAFTFTLSDEGNIRLSAELAGGSLMDVGCYCVNSMRFLTDEEPIGVQAFADFGKHSGVDERLTGILQFPGGVLGHFDSSLRTHRSHWYEVRGDKGRIVVPQSYVPEPDAMTVIYYEHGNETEAIEVQPIDQYQLMVEDFADALLNSRAPRFAPLDAVLNMKVIDALYQSAQHHQA